MPVTCELDEDGEYVLGFPDGSACIRSHADIEPETVLDIYCQFFHARKASPHFCVQTVDMTGDVIDILRTPDTISRVRKAARGILLDDNGEDMSGRCPDWLLAWADVFVREWLADYARSQEPLAVWRGSEVRLKTDDLICRVCEHVERALESMELAAA